MGGIYIGKKVISWIEIPVKDMAKVKKFYSSVFGKDLTDFPMPISMEMVVFSSVDGGKL
jgi:predicted enzyme related to lactoylglutathione lyase